MKRASPEAAGRGPNNKKLHTLIVREIKGKIKVLCQIIVREGKLWQELGSA